MRHTEPYVIFHRRLDQPLATIRATSHYAACKMAGQLNIRGDCTGALGYTAEALSDRHEDATLMECQTCGNVFLYWQACDHVCG